MAHPSMSVAAMAAVLVASTAIACGGAVESSASPAAEAFGSAPAPDGALQGPTPTRPDPGAGPSGLLADCSGYAASVASIEGKLATFRRTSAGAWLETGFLGWSLDHAALYVAPSGTELGAFWRDEDGKTSLFGTLGGATTSIEQWHNGGVLSPSVSSAVTNREYGDATLVTLTEVYPGATLTAARIGATNTGGTISSLLQNLGTIALPEFRRASAAWDAQGRTVVSGVTQRRELVVVRHDEGTWSAPENVPDVAVCCQEIEVASPQLVRHEADIVVFYLESPVMLAAVTRTTAGWTAPTRIAIPTSLNLAATSTAGVGATVAVRANDGRVLATRFGVARTFGALELVDTVDPDGLPGSLTATAGLCGDDALFSVATRGALKAARFKAGAAPRIETIATTGSTTPFAIAVARAPIYRD